MRGSAILLIGFCAACGGAGAESPRASSDEGAGGERPPAVREEPARILDEEEAEQTHLQAMQLHVRAEERRRLCEEGDEAACGQVRQLFELTADTWRALIEGRPDNEAAEWSFMLAQARLHSGRNDAAAEAADHYLALGAPEWRTQAAQLLVTARERSLEGVLVRETAPRAEGDPPVLRALEIPAPLQQLSDARARLAEVLAESGADPAARRAIALENALVLHRYGHWERAQEALRPLLDEGCAGEGAWEGGAIAWRALREIASSLRRHDAVRALGDDVERRSCDFGGTAPVCDDSSEHPRCLAIADRVAWRLRGGILFLQRAEQARGAERSQLAIRAGEAFLAALELEGELDARGRIIALVQASGAFRMAGAAPRAAEVDERIVREVHPAAIDEMHRALALTALASALSRQLEAALAASSHERVAAIAPAILAPALDRPALAEQRSRARSALPEALVALGRHADASQAFTALAAADGDPSVRREAELRAALALVPARNCSAATRPLRAFVTAHAAEAGAHDGVVRALWQLAECQRSGSRQHLAALEEVAQIERAGLGAEARGYVAEATFRLVDREFESATRHRLQVPAGENVEDLTPNLREQLAGPTERVRELLQGYARVELLGVGRWSAAARQRSGAALEALERAVLEASWELPLDLQRQRRTLNAANFAQIQRIVELRSAELLRAQAVIIRCRAAVHYRRAVQIAGAAGVDSPEAQAARERLGAMEIPARCPDAS